MSTMKCRFCFEFAVTAGRCADVNCQGYQNKENPEYALKAGTSVHSDYVIGAMLGAGGNALVYAGKQTSLDRRVAIKELFPDSLVSRVRGSASIQVPTASLHHFGQQKANFIKEAKLLAKLRGEQHPEVLAVLAHFSANDTAYVVTGFLDGVSLHQQVQRHGVLQGDKLAVILRGMIAGLHRVHAVHMLHLDVKPENFMFQKNGKVTLLDFGCAAFKEDDEWVLRGLRGQTPGYAAPEAGNSDTSTLQPCQDIYGLGATAYFIATGVHPPSVEERAGGRGFEPSLEWVSTNVSPVLANFIQLSMRIAPQERPQTMAEVDSLLAPLLEPVQDWTQSLPSGTLGKALKTVHADLASGKSHSTRFNWQAALLGPVWFAMYRAYGPAAAIGIVDAVAVAAWSFIPDFWAVFAVLLVLGRVGVGLLGQWLVYRSVAPDAEEITKSTQDPERRSRTLAVRLRAHFPSFACSFLLSIPLLCVVAVFGTAHGDMQRATVFRQLNVEPLMCAFERHIQTTGALPRKEELNTRPEHAGGEIKDYEVEADRIKLTLGDGPAAGKMVRVGYDTRSAAFTICTNVDVPEHLLPQQCNLTKPFPRPRC